MLLPRKEKERRGGEGKRKKKQNKGWALTNREMVNVGGKGHHHRRGHPLLQHAAQLALGIDLGTEGGHAKIVLGANCRHTLLLEAGPHEAGSGGGNEAETEVDTGLDLVRELPPEGGVEGAHGGLQLSRGDPVAGLVPGAVGDGTFGALGEGGTLPERLHSEGELGGDGLQVASNVDARHAALEKGRVEHLERGAEVAARVLVLELGHVLAARMQGELRLGDEAV